jgi:hypothetical protein
VISSSSPFCIGLPKSQKWDLNPWRSTIRCFRWLAMKNLTGRDVLRDLGNSDCQGENNLDVQRWSAAIGKLISVIYKNKRIMEMYPSYNRSQPVGNIVWGKQLSCHPVCAAIQIHK